jgi:hypothetical protein
VLRLECLKVWWCCTRISSKMPQVKKLNNKVEICDPRGEREATTMLSVPRVFRWAHWCLFPSWHHFKNFIVLDVEVFFCSRSWRAISAFSLLWNWWSSNCCSSKLLLLLIQSCLIYLLPCHAGPVSVIMTDVHWPLLNFALFSDITHSCHALDGEYNWERHVLTNKTESHNKLHCVTRFLMS